MAVIAGKIDEGTIERRKAQVTPEQRQLAQDVTDHYAQQKLEAQRARREAWKAAALEWDQQTQPQWDHVTANASEARRGMSGESLPAFAKAWDEFGRPYFGTGLHATIKHIASNLIRGTNLELALTGSKSESRLGDVPKIEEMPEIVAGREEAKKLWDEGKIFEAMKADYFNVRNAGLAKFVGFWEAGEDVPVIGGIVRAVGSIGTSLEFFQEPARTWEANIVGPKIVAQAEMLSDIVDKHPEIEAEYEMLRNLPKTIRGAPGSAGMLSLYNHAEEQGWVDKEEYKELLGEYRDLEVGRAAYTLWWDDAARDEFVRRARERQDPGLLALELGDPTAEMWGQMIADPTIIIQKVFGYVKAARLGRAEKATYATVANPGLVDELGKVAAAQSADEAAAASRGLVAETQRMYNAARDGITDIAARRGLFVPTAGGKQSIYGERIGNVMGSMLAHYKGDPDAFLSTLKGLVLAADPSDAAKVIEGMDILNNAGLRPQYLFSPATNEMTVFMREVLIDSAGDFNPTRLMNIFKKAESVDELAVLLGEYNDEMLKSVFPNIKNQVKQNAKYLELLAEDADEAARYLAQHPAADKAVSKTMQGLDNVHDFLQRKFYRPAAEVQSRVYMGWDPMFYTRNRWGNTVPMLIDLGPEAAGKTLFGKVGPIGFDPAKARQEVMLWTGGVSPPGATQGLTVAAAPFDNPIDAAMTGLLKYSSADEAGAAAQVYAASMRRNMPKALSAAINMDDLAFMSDGAKDSLRNLIINGYGDVDEAVRMLREGGEISAGRRLANLTDEQASALRNHFIYDDVQRILNENPALDEVEKALDDLARNYRQGGNLVSRETSLFDMSKEGAEGLARDARAIEKNISKEAADVFQCRAVANEAAQEAFEEATRNVEELARIKLTQEKVDIAIRLGADTNAAVESASENVSSMLDGFYDDIAKLKDTTRQQAWAFTDHTWEINDWAKEASSAERAQMWRTMGFPGEPPDNITVRQFRDVLWDEHYRPQQQLRYTTLRESTTSQYRARMQILAEEVGISEEKLAGMVTRPDAELARARMFDNAKIVRGQKVVDIQAGQLEEAVLSYYDDLIQAMPGGGSRDSLKAAMDRAREMGSTNQAVDVVYNIDQTVRDALESIVGPDIAEQKKALSVMLSGNNYRIVHDIEENTWRIVGPNVKDIRFLPREGTRPPIATFRESIVRGQGTGEEAAKFWMRNLIEDGEDYFLANAMTADKIVDGETVTGGQGFWNRMAEKGYVTNLGEVDGVEGWKYTKFKINPDAIDDIPSYRMNVQPPADNYTPSAARVHVETSKGVTGLIDDVKANVKDNWNTISAVEIDAANEKQLSQWVKDTRAKITEARAIGTAVATEQRNFILHHYGKRYGLDLVLGYIYPYQFWYSRTYKNWMKRLIQNPYLTASYARYRDYLEKQHAGLPDWFKYQINTNELLGLESENPLWFNLESTLNPLNGLVGVDFNDPKKRATWFGAFMDDLGKFGPSIWTPYQLALAVYYHHTGEEEAAARWAGRLIPQTLTIRDTTALMGFNEGKGIELDPAIHYFSGGLGVYERGRAGRMFYTMAQEGKYTEAELADAAYNQEGPIWDEAVARSINLRAPSMWQIVSPFVLGAGFRPRTPQDVAIDQFYQESRKLSALRSSMPLEEYRETRAQLEKKYPFMDAVLLSRTSGLERDEALAWNVFNRIPPGGSKEFVKTVGLDYEILQKFYDVKGDLTMMNKSDRMHLMAGVLDLAALLEVPDGATQEEWKDAKGAYSDMMAAGERLFGDDIWERVDLFYGINAKDTDDAREFLRKNVAVEEALDWREEYIMQDPLLAAYYTSIDKIEKYYKGEMYDEALKEFGDDLWDRFEVHSQLKERGDTAGASRYWKDNPQLKEYMNFRDERLVLIAGILERVGGSLPEGKPEQYREEQPESFTPSNEREAWIASQVLEYAGEPKAVESVGQETSYYLEALAHMPPSMQRLVMDYIFFGDALPEVVTTRLDQLGLPANEVLGALQEVAP